MNEGDTFVLKNQDVDDHLWVILSDPAADGKRVLIVSITTHEDHKDQACIIEANEHPWPTRRSCVAYNFARTTSRDKLFQLRDAGMLEMKDPVSKALLTRMRVQAGASVTISIEHFDVLEEQGLVD